MNTMFSGTSRSLRTLTSTAPRRVSSRIMSPGQTFIRRMSFGDMKATASGSIWSSTWERRVIEPVCQCSSTRPVESTIGYSSSGTSSGAITCAGTILPRPLSVGNPVVKMISLPGRCGSSTG